MIDNWRVETAHKRLGSTEEAAPRMTALERLFLMLVATSSTTTTQWLARHGGVTDQTARGRLKRMAESGLVHSTRQGNQVWWYLS